MTICFSFKCEQRKASHSINYWQLKLGVGWDGIGMKSPDKHLKYCNQYFKPYLYASDKESFPITLNGKKKNNKGNSFSVHLEQLHHSTSITDATLNHCTPRTDATLHHFTSRGFFLCFGRATVGLHKLLQTLHNIFRFLLRYFFGY